jgi:parallel beta-helix repeat protein
MVAFLVAALPFAPHAAPVLIAALQPLLAAVGSGSAVSAMPDGALAEASRAPVAIVARGAQPATGSSMPTASAASAAVGTSTPSPAASSARTAAPTATRTAAPAQTIAPTPRPTQTATVASPPANAVNVTAHGARRDGTTDDTAAIHRARDAAGSGGTLYFPGGTYVVAKLQANVAGQQWWLDPSATLRLRSGANTDVIFLAASDVTLRGGKIDGNRAAQTSSGTCVVITGQRVAVREVEIAECRGWGIYIYGADNAQLVRNHVHDTYGGAIFADDDGSTGANNTLIDGNTIKRTLNKEAGGITVHGNNSTIASSGARITNNYVEGVGQISIEVFGLAPDSFIQGNRTFGGMMGISVDKSDRTVVTGNTVTAAPTNSWGYWLGLEIAGASNVMLSGNTVDGNNAAGAVGVSVTNTSPQFNMITGNTIYRTTKGVFLGRGANNNTIIKNRIETFSARGIEVAGDHTTITENVIVNGASGEGIIIDNSSHEKITRNTIRAAPKAVTLYQSGAGSVDYVVITENRFESVGEGIVRYGAMGANNVYEPNLRL